MTHSESYVWETIISSKDVRGLIHKAHLAQQYALETRNAKLLKDVNLLFLGLMHLHELICVFRQHPRESITHIGTILGGLTRNGVYCRLRMVGLRPADLSDPALTMIKLIRKSNVLGPIAKRLVST